MMDKGRYSRLMVAFNERHHSLTTDGYYDIHTAYTHEMHYVKMRHFNGGVISLCADYYDFTLTQRSQGKVVHTEIIQ